MFQISIRRMLTNNIILIILTCLVIINSQLTSLRNLDGDIDNLFGERILQGCNPDICITTQGYCKSDVCICLEGFITVNNKDNHNVCNYKQKSSMWGLLLECFGLIGVGHLYAGRLFYGIFKMVCFYVIICYGSQFVIVFMKENSETEAAYYVKLIISVGTLVVPIIWHLIDLYMWANNRYLDGNGQSMLVW